MGGALALLVLLVLLGGRGKRAPTSEVATGLWVWPVPTYYAPDGTVYEATVSSGFESQRRSADGTLRPHRGLDVMFRRRSREDRPEHPDGIVLADGFASSPLHFAPIATPILAAHEGTVWSVKRRDDGGGISVIVDHGKPWATYYTHLETVHVAPGQRVRAGEPIGTMGGNRSDGSRVRHLHFGLWYDGHGEAAAVDVFGDTMQRWERRPWRPTS